MMLPADLSHPMVLCSRSGKVHRVRWRHGQPRPRRSRACQQARRPASRSSWARRQGVSVTRTSMSLASYDRSSEEHADWRVCCPEVKQRVGATYSRESRIRPESSSLSERRVTRQRRLRRIASLPASVRVSLRIGYPALQGYPERCPATGRRRARVHAREHTT